MARILLIGAMAFASATSIAAALSARDHDLIVVVSDDHPKLEVVAELKVLKYGEIVHLETGEVIPEFVPEVLAAPIKAVKDEVFHPPKVS